MKDSLQQFILYDCNYEKAIQRSHRRELLVARREKEQALGRDVHSWRIFAMNDDE